MQELRRTRLKLPQPLLAMSQLMGPARNEYCLKTFGDKLKKRLLLPKDSVLEPLQAVTKLCEEMHASALGCSLCQEIIKQSDLITGIYR